MGFVIGPVTQEQARLAVSFERQNVSADAVQEPSVVADDDGASGEVFQGFLQRPKGIHVQVVGGFVEQKHVGALCEGFRQVDSVAFAARERSHQFLLVAAKEIKG